MLPEFARVREILIKQQHAFLTAAARMYSGPFQEAAYSIMHEGDGLVSHYDDNTVHASPVKKLASSFKINLEEIKNNPMLVYQYLLTIGRDFADQQVKMSVDTIREVTEMVGNIHQAKGVVSPDDILAMFDRVEITFGPTGEPYMPSIVAGGPMADQINAALLAIQANPEQTQKFQEIIDRKRRQWYDRENNRKLVD